MEEGCTCDNLGSTPLAGHENTLDALATTQVLVVPTLPEPVCAAAMGRIPLLSQLLRSSVVHSAAGSLECAI